MRIQPAIIGVFLLAALATRLIGQERTPLAKPKARPAKTTGVIEGVVTFTGDVPKSRVRDDAGLRRNLLTVDRKSRGLAYLLVYLDLQPTRKQDGTKNKADKEKREEGEGKPKAEGKKKDRPLIIDQLEHTFIPHLVALRDGERVKFTNSDSANHNVRGVSFQPKNNFNIFTGAGGSYEHRFFVDRKVRPVRLGCDIHPWMSAWIYVFKHPHFAVSDKKGKFRIASVPPGEYQLAGRQPDVGYKSVRKITVAAGKTTRVEIRVGKDDIKIP